MNLLQKIERKLGKYAISNLIQIIVIGMGIVFVLTILFPLNITDLLDFSKFDIMQGQVWRLFSFVFIPPNFSPIFIIFALYFYLLIGSSLEREWGKFKFNIFYFVGILGTIIAGMITGYATNSYLNLSLFLAFAILYPNFEILLFFVIPVKMKYLAFLDVLFFIYSLIISTWPGRIALIVSLLNIALFFGGDFIKRIKNMNRRAKWRRAIRG